MTHTNYSIRMHQHLTNSFQRQPKMAIFWSNIESFGFEQAVEDPLPILRVLDAKEAECRDTAITQTQFTASVCTKNCPFYEKGPKMSVFLSKIDFFGFRQAVEHTPPSLTLLDATPQVVGTEGSHKDNLEPPNAPKCAIFVKHSPKMAILWSKNEFFGLSRAVEDPPYFEVAECEKPRSGGTQITKTEFRVT